MDQVIPDINKPISEMTDEEIMEHIAQLRAARALVREKRAAVAESKTPAAKRNEVGGALGNILDDIFKDD